MSRFLVLAMMILAAASVARARPPLKVRCARAVVGVVDSVDTLKADEIDRVVAFITGIREQIGFDPESSAAGKALFDDLSRFEQYYDGTNGRFFVMYGDGGELIGTIAYTKLADRVFELKKFYVHPEGRGRGIGRRLLDRVITEVKSAGAQVLVLQTDRRMTAARHLYEKSGFKAVAGFQGGSNAVFYELEFDL